MEQQRRSMVRPVYKRMASPSVGSAFHILIPSSLASRLTRIQASDGAFVGPFLLSKVTAILDANDTSFTDLSDLPATLIQRISQPSQKESSRKSADWHTEHVTKPVHIKGFAQFIGSEASVSTLMLLFLMMISLFSCNTLPVPSCHATRRTHEGWDSARSPKPKQGKSRGRGGVRTTDIPVSKFAF
ncbi:hypothetical protein CSKR_114247 [Clonorchis sinensis]|uniref:Uncharacterized protein n=1 Tax=Clonorchis sinensis TaxID=79923 RepID=A0A3R7H0C2_CLOSI|nr:hypothetical protein CSKR_114247 [Clonorchis sinensis]